jgi:DNA-binding NarL/FixJ family response regulator
MTIRVLIVDDHPVFRDGLAAALTAAAGIEVTAQASDGNEAVALAAAADVDVVAMDLSLPGMSGIEATSRICALPCAPAVVVITMVDDEDTIAAALQAGARGYVLKGSSGRQIAAAVRAIAEGGAVFGSGVAAQVLSKASSTTPDGAPADGLTGRERDVLALLAEGASNAQIARALGLSVKTVQNYVSRILDKLQVADRTKAALLARGLDGQAGPPAREPQPRRQSYRPP